MIKIAGLKAMQRTTTGYDNFWYSSDKAGKKDHFLFLRHKKKSYK